MVDQSLMDIIYALIHDHNYTAGFGYKLIDIKSL